MEISQEDQSYLKLMPGTLSLWHYQVYQMNKSFVNLSLILRPLNFTITISIGVEEQLFISEVFYC